MLPVFLLIGACGGSAKSSSSASSSTTAASGTAARTATATTRSGTTRSGTTTATSTGSTSAPTPTQTTTGSASGGGSTNARVPATFAIGPGGRLTPPFVSSPAFLAVQLTVGSGDGGAHRVTVRVPKLYSLFVPAHGRATLLIRGLRAGRYPIEIDGTPRGALMIGGEPGP